MFKEYRITGKSKKFFLIFLLLTSVNTVAADNRNLKNDVSKIELVGTITGKHVLAILRYKNQSEGIYQINQSIHDFTITAITKNSVTLKKNNESTVLNLIAVKNRPYYGNNISEKRADSIATYKYRINRKTFNSLRNDTQSWLNNVRMKMLVEEGYLTGYRITRIQKNSPADLLGLSEGDVITGINNILIKQSPENFITKIGQLQDAKQFILNMKREQLTFKLEFIIEDKN